MRFGPPRQPSALRDSVQPQFFVASSIPLPPGRQEQNPQVDYCRADLAEFSATTADLASKSIDHKQERDAAGQEHDFQSMAAPFIIPGGIDQPALLFF